MKDKPVVWVGMKTVGLVIGCREIVKVVVVRAGLCCSGIAVVGIKIESFSLITSN